MTPTKLIELLIKTVPYPDQIRDIEIEDAAVCFEWRSQRFRVSTRLFAETVGNGVLIGDDASILLTAMLKRASVG